MKVFILLLITLTVSVAYFFVEPMVNGELSDKQVYAALQAAEMEHRNNVGGILYQEKDGYQMVGITNDDRKRIWVVLNSVKDKVKLYSIPDLEDVPIKCDAVDLLISKHEIGAAVAEILRASCIR